MSPLVILFFGLALIMAPLLHAYRKYGPPLGEAMQGLMWEQSLQTFLLIQVVCGSGAFMAMLGWYLMLIRVRVY